MKIKTLNLCWMALAMLVPSITIAAPNEADVPELEASQDAGFRFLGGDVERGKVAFSSLGCIQCHKVAKADLPEPEGKRRLNLQLGQDARFVKRYEYIVLAITNPQHVIDEQYKALLQGDDVQAFMPNLAGQMTAQQLMDIATFLDHHYRESHPAYGK